MEAQSYFYGSDYLAAGAFFGLLLTCVFRKEKYRLWAPLFIPLCAVIVSLPYILLKIGVLSLEAAAYPWLDFYFTRTKFSDRGAVSLLILLVVFLYTCLYYIKYSKELLIELRRSKEHAQ